MQKITPIVFKLTMPNMAPLGIAYIASYLETYGYNVKIIDAHVENLSDGQVLQKVKIFKPDVVGFSANVTSTPALYAYLARKIKELNPNIITVIGGIVVTFLPKETLEVFPDFDFVIRYEGEITFLSLLEALKNNYNLADIKGLVYRNGNKEIVINPKREHIEDLDSLPFPARHLLPNHLYRLWIARRTAILSARGCFGRCAFCIVRQVYGYKIRKRRVERVVDEIEECYFKYNYTNFTFIDSTFTSIRTYALCLTDEIIKRGLHKKVTWNCVTRVDCIDRELLLAMKKAGCIKIEFGVEAGSQTALDQYNKRITLSQIEEAVKLTKKIGITTGILLILDQYLKPEELRKNINETYNFTLKLNPDDMRITPLVALPNTEMHNYLSNNKNVKENDYLSFLKDYYIESKYLSKKQINRYINKIYTSFWFRPSFVINSFKNHSIWKIINKLR